jgi:hypothetical protein
LSFGTIDELLPALYMIKHTVIDEKKSSVDLYGFSAGGGALINTLAVLNSSKYDAQLKKVGIGSLEKKKMLFAIQNGLIILDAPLKSIEEIIDGRGSTEELERIAKQYRNNDLRPIDSLQLLKGLSLRVLLYFQKNDEILFNRDDQLYIKRLRAGQPNGRIHVVMGEEGGHNTPHMPLWNYYFSHFETSRL